MRLSEIMDNSVLLEEALWWVQRWVSGSIRDPAWDESWLSSIKNFNSAIDFLHKLNPKSPDRILYRYLGVSEATFRKLKTTNKYYTGKNIIQSFTTSLKTAKIIADDLQVSGKYQIIIKCDVPSTDIILDIGSMFKDKRFYSTMGALLDWKHQNEVLVKTVVPIEIIKIIELNQG